VPEHGPQRQGDQRPGGQARISAVPPGDPPHRSSQRQAERQRLVQGERRQAVAGPQPRRTGDQCAKPAARPLDALRHPVHVAEQSRANGSERYGGQHTVLRSGQASRRLAGRIRRSALPGHDPLHQPGDGEPRHGRQYAGPGGPSDAQRQRRQPAAPGVPGPREAPQAGQEEAAHRCRQDRPSCRPGGEHPGGGERDQEGRRDRPDTAEALSQHPGQPHQRRARQCRQQAHGCFARLLEPEGDGLGIEEERDVHLGAGCIAVHGPPGTQGSRRFLRQERPVPQPRHPHGQRKRSDERVERPFDRQHGRAGDHTPRPSLVPQSHSSRHAESPSRRSPTRPPGRRIVPHAAGRRYRIRLAP